jgi:hypothetical protein
MFGIRRLLRTAAVVAFIASIALLAVPALDRAFQEQVKAAIAQAKAELEHQLGLTISFESLSPSILHSIAFSAMTLKNPQGQVFLTAGKVRVYYDIFAILRGEPNNALKTITLDNATADIVLPRDNALLARLSPYIFPPPGMPAPKFKLVGRTMLLHVRDEGLGSFTLSARDFSYSNLGATTDISLSGGFTAIPAHGSIGSIEGPLELSGSISQDFSMARAQIAVAGSAPDFSFGTQRFELVYSKGIVELRKVRDKAPLDMTLTFDPRDGSVSASLRMDGFVPDRSFHLFGALAAFSPWMHAPYDGSLSFGIPSGDLARAHYSLSLDASLPEYILHSPYRASISATGDLRQARIDYLRIGNSARSVEYKGTFDFSDFSPDGTLAIWLSLRQGRLPIAASFRLYGHAGIYTALAEKVDVAGALFRDLSIAAAYKGDTLEFQASLRPPEAEGETPVLPSRHFAGEGGVAFGSFPRISIEGSASLGAHPSLDVSASLDEIDLQPLQNLLALALDSPQAAAFLGNLKLGGELFATSDFSRLSWSASDLAVVSRSAPGAYALLSLSGNLQTVSVRSMTLSAGGYSVQGTGSVDFAEAGRLGFEANLKLQDIPYHLRGVLVGQGLFLTGDYGLNIDAHVEAGGTFFTAAAKSLPLPLAGGVVLATLDADGRFASLADWSVAMNKLDIAPADDRTSKLPHLSLSGVFGPTSARLALVNVEDRFSRLSGSVSMEYVLSGALSLRVKASLSAAARPLGAIPEQYALELDYGKGQLSGNLDFKASPLRRLGFGGLVGSLDGRLGIHGTLSDPLLDFDATLRDGMIGVDPLALSLKGGFSGETLRVDTMSAAYLRQRIRSGSFSYSFADSSTKFSLDFVGDWGARPVTLTLEGDGSSLSVDAAPTSAGAPATDTASASSAAPALAAGAVKSADGFPLLRALPAALRNYHLSGLMKNLTVGAAKVASWPFDLSITPRLLQFSGGAGNDLVAAFQSTGVFWIRSSLALPVALSASGKLVGDSVDARIDNIDVDLAALSPVLPIGTTSFDAGRVRGFLVVKGLVADPDITGDLNLGSVVISVPNWLSTKIGPFSAPVSVLGKGIAFSASNVPAGKARLDVRATADLDHWTPSNFKAFVSTGNGAPLDIDLGISGVLVKGQANFDLSVELRADVLALTGTVTLQRSSVVISPEVLGGGEKESSGPPAYPILVQARLRFGRGVEVFFPSKDLPVVSGYADPVSVLNLHYDQSVEDLSVKGTLALRGGDVFYIQRSFFLKSATIIFNESLDHFDPRVTMLAELRDSSDQGPVLITLRTDNQPISGFKPTLSSDPPMSESDIAGLLGSGLFDVSSNQTIDIRKAVISSSEFLPQLNVVRAFEQRVRDSLGLDVLFLQTQFLQRWLINVSDPAQTAATNPLASYLDQTALYVGKYIGDSVFVHGQVRFQQDPLVSTQPLRIDSELGIEFDTPFGIVQWTIAPTRPDTLYISDQSLSLTWRLSY